MPRPVKLPDDLGEILDKPRYFSRKTSAALFEHWERISLDQPEDGLEIAAFLEEFCIQVLEHSERLSRLALDIRAKAICARAGNLRALQRSGEAEETLLHGLEVIATTDKLNRANILRNLAILRGNQLRYTEALGLVEKAIALASSENQTLGKAILAKGVILYNQGNGSEALATICTSLKYLDPRKSEVIYFKALHNLMVAVVDVRDFAGLSVLKGPLREARSRLPSNSEVLRRRFRWVEGIAALRLGANRLAEEILTDTLVRLDTKLTPQERFHLRVDLAQACMSIDQKERAIVLLHECMEILRAAGKPEEAIAEVEQLAAELQSGGRGRLPWDVRSVVGAFGGTLLGT